MADGAEGRFTTFLPSPISQHPKIVIKDLTVTYRGKEYEPAVKNVSLTIAEGLVTAFIGASGCGKSTFLRSMNRMNEIIDGAKTTGSVRLEGEEVYGRHVDTAVLRSRVGMVFQKPNPFPKSIYENVAYGPTIHKLAKGKRALDEIVERSLQQAGLWAEVKDRLQESGLSLSGGQQQRLIIARAMAVNPDVILMDEPCSALDPSATAGIEQTIGELSKAGTTVVIVTHNMYQAARISHHTAFFHLGELVEKGTAEEIFQNPKNQKTQDFITGRFG